MIPCRIIHGLQNQFSEATKQKNGLYSHKAQKVSTANLYLGLFFHTTIKMIYFAKIFCCENSEFRGVITVYNKSIINLFISFKAQWSRLCFTEDYLGMVIVI